LLAEFGDCHIERLLVAPGNGDLILKFYVERWRGGFRAASGESRADGMLGPPGWRRSDMRVLFMQQAGALGIGGLTRCLAVATEAALLGHKTGFFCRRDVHRFVRKTIDTEVFAAPVPPEKVLASAPAKNFTLADSIRIRNMDDIEYLRQTVAAEVQVIKGFAPDAIFTENQFTAALSGAITSVPLITTAATVNHPLFESPLYRPQQKVRGIEDNFNLVLRSNALPEIRDISELSNGRSALNIAPTIPELEPLLTSFPNNQYVGQLLFSKLEIGPVNRMTKAGNGPILFVYMSRGSIRPDDFIPELIRCFEHRPCFVVIAMRTSNFKGRKLPYAIRKNIVLHDIVPGLSTISRSALVITRGGQNTTMACMLAGVPVSASPVIVPRPTSISEVLPLVALPSSASPHNFAPNRSGSLSLKCSTTVNFARARSHLAAEFESLMGREPP